MKIILRGLVIGLLAFACSEENFQGEFGSEKAIGSTSGEANLEDGRSNQDEAAVPPTPISGVFLATNYSDDGLNTTIEVTLMDSDTQSPKLLSSGETLRWNWSSIVDPIDVEETNSTLTLYFDSTLLSEELRQAIIIGYRYRDASGFVSSDEKMIGELASNAEGCALWDSSCWIQGPVGLTCVDSCQAMGLGFDGASFGKHFSGETTAEIRNACENAIISLGFATDFNSRNSQTSSGDTVCSWDGNTLTVDRGQTLNGNSTPRAGHSNLCSCR